MPCPRARRPRPRRARRLRRGRALPRGELAFWSVAAREWPDEDSAAARVRLATMLILALAGATVGTLLVAAGAAVPADLGLVQVAGALGAVGAVLALALLARRWGLAARLRRWYLSPVPTSPKRTSPGLGHRGGRPRAAQLRRALGLRPAAARPRERGLLLGARTQPDLRDAASARLGRPGRAARPRARQRACEADVSLDHRRARRARALAGGRRSGPSRTATYFSSRCSSAT